jgi:hypothetical protein
VTTIYVDWAAVAVRGEAAAGLDPDAVRSLRFLADAGHGVVVVANEPAGVPPELDGIARELIAHLPLGPAEPAWYLTAEVERCQGVSARLRTILIGAAPPAGSIHRCDAVARDLQAAALEILASEAMPSG